MSSDREKQKKRNWRAKKGFFLIGIIFVFFAACTEIQKPEPEPFYSETIPPAKQEFRWSNGKAPKSFDPARAAAAPETDVVRALFEGLTDLDTTTLKEVPAVAEKWTSSPDFRVWTFQLRKDASWSNGDPVTADDFVTSWRRLEILGDKAAHRELFQNIVGLKTNKTVPLLPTDPVDLNNSPIFGEESQHVEPSNSVSTTRTPGTFPQLPAANTITNPKIANKTTSTTKSTPAIFGVAAIDDTTLQVTLASPDKDFPKLVANPIFRPVYGDGIEFDNASLDPDVVTNGPFTVASVELEGVSLARSVTYWNKANVNLEQVKFVSKENAEAALTAYKKGEIDALTNTEFEPLAVKLLSPYDDFRQTTHSALNFYEFQMKNPPFNDRRVREALAISIDRERITDGELEGTARPALSFLPLSDKKKPQLSFNIQKAKQLLIDSGFGGGVNFPPIRLLINRNDTQQRVARAVAKMWKQNLNLDTQIIVKEMSEIAAARALGEYDLVRRGVVLPTVDRSVALTTIFGGSKNPASESASANIAENPDKAGEKTSTDRPLEDRSGAVAHGELDRKDIVTEDNALLELNAIPLYFPMAYSLVKPYVKGFQVNGLDAASLEDISIDSGWQPKTVKGAS